MNRQQDADTEIPIVHHAMGVPSGAMPPDVLRLNRAAM